MSKFTEFAEDLKVMTQRADDAHITVSLDTMAYMIELLEKAEKCRKKAKRYRRMYEELFTVQAPTITCLPFLDEHPLTQSH